MKRDSEMIRASPFYELQKNQNLISKKTNVSFPFLLKCFYIQFKQFV